MVMANHGAADVRHLLSPPKDHGGALRSSLEALLTLEKASSRELVDRLFREFGSLSEALAASHPRLVKVIGTGPAKTLRNFQSLIDAVLQERVRARPWISVKEMAQFLNFEIGYSPVELFYAFYLDGAGSLIHAELVARGSTKSALVDARQVIIRAVEFGASSFLVAHNHPSGAARPSKSDLELTARLERMAADFDLRLIDHLIAARGRIASVKRGELIEFTRFSKRGGAAAG
jgi:DNA repair protein RadC